MPLNTRIERDGEALRLHWSHFHIAAMAIAASVDAGGYPLSDITGLYLTDELPPAMFDCYPDAPFPITRGLAFILSDYGALSKTPLDGGGYTLTRKHKFIDLTDGEVLELRPGDLLQAWRSW